jgi:hypothetical protein
MISLMAIPSSTSNDQGLDVGGVGDREPQIGCGQEEVEPDATGDGGEKSGNAIAGAGAATITSTRSARRWYGEHDPRSRLSRALTIRAR